MLDEELRTAGGRLPWAALRNRLVGHLCASGTDLRTSSEEVGLQALSCISEDYLNKTDELVRLPAKRAFGPVKHKNKGRSPRKGELVRIGTRSASGEPAPPQTTDGPQKKERKSNALPRKAGCARETKAKTSR